MLGEMYNRASSETSLPIGLQLFSRFGFAGENDTERAQTNPRNDHPLTPIACTSSADSRRDWVEGVSGPTWDGGWKGVGCAGFSPARTRKAVG
jgi:hypothetical protein